MARSKVVFTPLPEPTLAERHSTLSHRAEVALSIFQTAATELEVAADELEKISDEAATIADEHTARAIAADEEAARHRNAASKIRNFLA